MTKFEQIGVNMQYEALTKTEAKTNFSRSCDCCCNRGMKINCDRCAIATANKLVVATFEGEGR